MKKEIIHSVFFICCFFITPIFFSQNFQWANSVGGSGLDRITDIHADALGNATGVGYASSTFIVGTDTINTAGNKDVVVVQYNLYGGVNWVKSFGSNGEDLAKAIAVDVQNNIFVGGHFTGTVQFDTITLTSSGAKDAFILKMNSSGDVLSAIHFGGSGDDFCNDIALSNNGELIVGGGYNSSFSFGGFNLGNAGTTDVYLMKLDSAFNPVWLKGNGASLNDNCTAVCVDLNGNIFAAGQYKGQIFPPVQVPFPINCSSGNLLNGGVGGAEDVWVAKIDGSTGCYSWVKTIYGGSIEEAMSITCEPSGANCYVVGTFGTNAFFDGNQYNTAGNYDGYLCKLSGGNGSFSVVKNLGGTGNDAARSIQYTNQGLFISGSFDATMSLGNGISLTSQGGQDAYVGQFDSNGNCLWAVSCGGSIGAQDQSYAIDLYNNKHLFISGMYAATNATFGSLPVLSNPGSETGFISRIDILPTTPSICLITVDSISKNNVIYWDKTPYSSGDIFTIYRDIGNNNYMPLTTIPFDSLSEFTDTLRSLYSANGDPNVSSWRYKISVLDTFSNESLLSPYHQTIFFQNNQANFSWNQYLIEGQTSPVPALQNYEFLRDDNTSGNWQVIQTLSASSTAYTDPNFSNFQNTGSWRVKTIWNITCDPTRGLINTSRSNIKGVAVGSVGIQEEETDFNINIYPNPSGEVLHLEFNSNNTEISCVEILDIKGILIKKMNPEFNSSLKIFTLDVSDIETGIYFLKISSPEKSTYKKWMKN